MSIWQVILLLIFLFFIALYLSFKKEKTGLRTVMRGTSIAIPIILVSAFFIMENSISKGCYSNEQNFYERKGALCYGTDRITQVTTGDRGLEIDRFIVLSKNKVVIHTKDGGDFVGSYANGTFIVKWLDDLVY
ncbi:hypothetical protein [Photorhabdus heterorhabditis]|uniref:hypothetical protein n=1 Tax=Photorhabdus heterorhabditis TaxID=880156 RepID=UPI001BD54D0B|nr:hypothetical protein [Photorhabdus heterorhabditis]MBS9442504.1 hypothetical protein [Photorhabdus heterorhabditis]